MEIAKIKIIVVECPCCLNLIEHPADDQGQEFTCDQCNTKYVTDEAENVHPALKTARRERDEARYAAAWILAWTEQTIFDIIPASDVHPRVRWTWIEGIRV